MELRDMFNIDYYNHLAKEFAKLEPGFPKDKFVDDVTINIENLSLNERMRQTSLTLKKYLPDNYAKAVELMMLVIPQMEYSYTQLVFPDFVGVFGHDHFDISMEALAYFTSYGSSEFAVREFLARDIQKTMKILYKWSESGNLHVRRLASEGSRPRLPWSFQLREVIKNPQLTRPILENLKADPELYVKKSVANHLNDISKDSPAYMLNLVQNWGLENDHTSWIIKRACRTLIKKGHPEALALFDCNKQIDLEIQDFSVSHANIRQDEKLLFSFKIRSSSDKVQKLIVDYQIHYCKKSGERWPKVFKLKEIDLFSGQVVQIQKTHLFRDLTTRKHYSGMHQLDILINGNVVQSMEFELMAPIVF